MLLVKLGGSLLGEAKLLAFLNTAKQQQWPIVFLPGGGQFADLVRRQQQAFGFSDKSAHRMAIMAMQQYAELLHDLSGIEFFKEENTLLPQIYPPLQLLKLDMDLPEDWTVTSDSLAIFLATKIHARRCVLLKSGSNIDQALSVAELSSQGVIDSYAPGLIADTQVDLSVISIEQLDHLQSMFV